MPTRYPVPPAREITPQSVYLERRRLLARLAAGSGGAVLAAWASRQAWAQGSPTRPGKNAALPAMRTSQPGGVVMDKLTPYQDVTTYNNFY